MRRHDSIGLQDKVIVVTGAGSDIGRAVERQVRPIVAWAWVGAAFLALQAFVFTFWISSGRARPTPVGDDPVPGYMAVFARVWEVGMVIGIALLLWLVVIRPWRRQRTPSFDGLLVLALFTMWWQDPLINYTQTWFTYNAVYWNLGSWTVDIPGWLSPNGNLLPEPIAVLPMYGAFLFLFAVAGSEVMRKAKARWPHLGKFGLICVCYGFMLLCDLLLEPLIWLPLGMYSFPGAIPSLTLFHGHYYQFPLYEAVFVSAFFGGYGVLRYFRNDLNQTVAERGLERLRFPARGKTSVRFAALVGICNLIFLVTYNIPIQLFGMHAGPWPEDFRTRSYLTNGFCGEGTTYACSSPTHPIPRRTSARVGPDGELIPAGTPRIPSE